ncbi:BamA/TamA family outer membrane protein [Akkermansiaceae bacterium]|nr:BamA/TamA family outer membrane protein [Akkermansiaceae bacterium]
MRARSGDWFFIDAAGLDSEVELAAGIGVRINLPVGPIRLEYGRSLSQDSGEPGGAFHFAIGTTF